MPQYQGIWSLQQQAQAQTNQQWVEDPYFKNTVLLLQADNVANGSNNNLFIDSSSNAFEITRNGNATQGSFTPYGPGWSVFFNGSSAIRVNTSFNSLFNQNDGNWTIECWAYPTSTTTSYIYATQANNSGFLMLNYNGGYFKIDKGTTGIIITSADTFPTNQWHHVAYTYDGTTVRLFVNGTLQGSAASVTVATHSSGVSIGDFGASSPFTGYVSNFRVTKGTARYLSNFTPSNLPLSCDANVVFLTSITGSIKDDGPFSANVTPFRNANVTPFSPFTSSFAPIATTYSTLFDGANAHANVSTSAANANLILSTSDFTIESWIFPRALGSERAIVSKWSNTTGGRAWVFELNSSNQPTFLYSTDGNATIRLTGTTAVVGNAWTHVAISRSANTANIYVNGILSGSNASFSPNIFAANVANVNIGRYMNAAANIAVWNGLISNARVVKGTAVYTSNFTPSQAPLTAIANTSLLVCQSNTIVDAGPSNFTIATQGNVGVSSSVIPFDASYQENPTYQTSTIGGSGYFDGSDFLSFPTSNSTLLPGTGQFTFELWIYPTLSTYVNDYLFSYGTTAGRLRVFIENGGLQVWNGSTTLTQGNTNLIKYGAWNHVVVQRNATNLVTYVNGIRDYNAANSTDFNGGTLQICADAGIDSFTGYISGFRYIKGSAIYSGSPIVLPTTPPLPTNTTACLNFTNASIYDATMKNNLETVGDVQISTLPYENGSGSIKFDGTGDYIIAANTHLTAFATADFTVETWLYPTSLPGTAQYIFDARATTTGAAIQFYINTTKTLGVAVGTTVVATTGTILELNKWSHVALVKNNGSWMIYINGKASVTSASLTNTTSLTQTGVVTIGASTNNRTTSTTDKFTGYMDDFRVTSGVARYTSNFIPPKQALPRQ